MTSTVTIPAEDYEELVAKAKHLDRAYALWKASNFNDGHDRALNITRFHDLLGMESGAANWPDETFLDSAARLIFPSPPRQPKPLPVPSQVQREGLPGR